MLVERIILLFSFIQSVLDNHHFPDFRYL